MFIAYILMVGKRFEELEDKYKKFLNAYDELCVHANHLSDYIRDLDTEFSHHIGLEDGDECDDEDDDVTDDILLLDPEEYLFGEYKKMRLIYNKEDDKLRYVGPYTLYEPCYFLHPSKIIGDGLSFFGFRSGEDNVVYVRNHTLKTDFVISLDIPNEFTKVVPNAEPSKEEEPMKGNECRIKHVDGHYEVYVNGEFYCSADTMTEAAKELENRLAEEREEEC
jgi:hypothetical protein